MSSRAPRIRPLFTLYMPLAPFVLFALFPLYFMAITSLKKNAELYDVTTVPFLIKRGVTFGHYQLLSQDTLFWSWFVNSLIVSVAATVISVVIGILAAYPLARYRFRGRGLGDVVILGRAVVRAADVGEIDPRRKDQPGGRACRRRRRLGADDAGDQTDDQREHD